VSTRIDMVVRWAARLGALVIAALLLAFVLGEPAGPLPTSLRDLAGMGLLFGAVLAMLVAWKWELPGALISLFALVAFAAIVHIRGFGVLAVASVPNILFLVDWKLRRVHSRATRKAN
jgi:hypothetical protein